MKFELCEFVRERESGTAELFPGDAPAPRVGEAAPVWVGVGAREAAADCDAVAREWVVSGRGLDGIDGEA